MTEEKHWLVRLEAIGGFTQPYAKIVVAEHGAAAIVAVLSEWHSGDEPMTKVSAERVGI